MVVDWVFLFLNWPCVDVEFYRFFHHVVRLLLEFLEHFNFLHPFLLLFIAHFRNQLRFWRFMLWFCLLRLISYLFWWFWLLDYDLFNWRLKLLWLYWFSTLHCWFLRRDSYIKWHLFEFFFMIFRLILLISLLLTLLLLFLLDVHS